MKIVLMLICLCCDESCNGDCGGFQKVHLFDQSCHMINFLVWLILMLMKSGGWCWLLYVWPNLAGLPQD